MAKKIDEAKVQQYMRIFGISEAEALQMLEDDATIDAGGKCEWETEPTAEQKKAMRQARMADRSPKEKATKRAKKENPDKQRIISAFVDCITEKELGDWGSTINVVNPEREFEFSLNGITYKVVLSVPRK
jgi:hypothetical protein